MMESYRVLIQTDGDRGQDLSCLLIHHLGQFEEQQLDGTQLDVRESPLTHDLFDDGWVPHFRVGALAESCDERIILQCFATREINDRREVLLNAKQDMSSTEFNDCGQKLAEIVFSLPGGIHWQVRYDRLMSRMNDPDFDLDAVWQMTCLLPDHMRTPPSTSDTAS